MSDPALYEMISNELGHYGFCGLIFLDVLDADAETVLANIPVLLKELAPAVSHLHLTHWLHEEQDWSRASNSGIRS
jgi:hypothetical protein